MNTTKIFTKAIFVVSILLSALLIGCNDMIEPMAQVELTVRMDDHNIPLTSSFTLYGTKQGSRATIQKELGSLNAISLLPLEPGIWDLTVEAKVEGIRKGTGSRTVSVNKGQKVSAVIELAYEYDLTFNANEGTPPSMAGKDVIYDAEYGPLATTERTGYTFLGWYTAINGGTKIEETDKFTQTTNQVLYAQWEANSYSITFDMQQGSGGSVSTTATFGAAMQSGLTVPSRTGYTFDGYYDAANGGGTQYYTATMASARAWDKTAPNTTLYAKWTADSYTITYNLNDGTNNAGNPATYTIESATIALQAPTRAGYTFGGWYATDTFSGSALTTITQGSTGSKTLYAKWTATSYTVSFDKQSGTGGSGSVSATYDAAMPKGLEAPNRTGYTFGGYYDAANGGGTQYYTATMASARAWDKTAPSTTLYAKWTADSYTITYNLNNGTNNAGNPATYTIESSAIALLAPTRNGYTFGGWYENISLTGSPVTEIPHGSTENKTLYAKWTATIYTITYNLNNGTNNAGNHTAYTIESSAITLLAPTRNGYTFGGWYGNAALTGVQVTSIAHGSSGNSEVWAKWTATSYTITYNLNNGTNNAGNPATYTVESSTIALLAPTRTGYTFSGWYADSNFTGGAAASILQGSTENKTLYAKWTPIAYSISYVLNDGTIGEGNPNSYTIESSTIALQNPTRTGYTFGGWFETDTFSGTALATIAQGSTGNKTLYAKWTVDSYTITYNLNNGTNNAGNPATYTVESSAIALLAPTRNGYTFGGWFETDTFSDTALTTIAQGSTGNKTLYAKWTSIAYSISYVLNDGTNNVGNPATYTIESSAIALQNPTRTGYTFGGWFETDTFSGSALTTIAQGSTGNKTLYAKWTVDSYTITYNLNDGTNNAGNPATYTVESSVIALLAPTRNGYTFGGWYATDTFSGSALTTITQGSIGNKTLYAKWTATSYSVSFDKQSGTGGSGSVSATYDAAMPTGLVAPNRTGYTFGGYYDAANGGGTQYYTATMASARTWDKTAPSTTLYAKWTADSYTITYYLNEGINNAGNPATYTVESSTIALLAPTRTGYTFGGWYENISLTGSPITEIPHGSTGNKTLYAKWINYEVGGLGPAGGYIFYDKGTYSDGWRYLEAAKEDIKRGSVTAFTYGYYRPAGENLGTGATGTGIGTGKANTASLVARMGATAYTESSGTPTTSDYAGKVADDYTVTNNGVTYSDWFLPSWDELNQMYLNLKCMNLGDFITDTFNEYWSSSEYDSGYAMYHRFDDNYRGYYSRHITIRVRAVRAF